MDLIFDNAGNALLITPAYCHSYDCGKHLAQDVALILKGTNPSTFDGNEPEFRRTATEHDDTITLAELKAYMKGKGPIKSNGGTMTNFLTTLLAEFGLVQTAWSTRTYDVWGNAKDGYDVNDARSGSDVTLYLKIETANAGTPQAFQHAHPTDSQIKKELGISCKISTDGDDVHIGIERARDGYPIGELQCFSHESLSPIQNMETQTFKTFDDLAVIAKSIGGNRPYDFSFVAVRSKTAKLHKVSVEMVPNAYLRNAFEADVRPAHLYRS
jgi:hypothetical protein